MGLYIIKAGLAIAGVINLLPLMGALSAGRLEKLYGLKITDPNLEILMRHRAVLFGIVGALLLTAIFKPEWQALAITVGLISMMSFVVLTILVKEYSGAFQHILIADIIGIIALLCAAIIILKS